LGDLSLWGDNSNFKGKMNINEGHFYMLFDEADAWTQRHNSILGADVEFKANTIFRPQMSSTKLANITGTITADATALFMPYEISKLAANNYTYSNVDYSAFMKSNGYISTSDLSTISSDGTNTYITVNDMVGYKNLSSLADAYRKRNNLSDAERYELDYIYITGMVSQAIIDKFEALGGKDYEIYEQVHRGSVRQFSRQVVSRIQNRNKDCQDCVAEQDYSDEHFWFNISRNEIKKDSSSKSLGYKYRPNGFAFGYDQDFIPERLNMGLAFSYANGEAKTASSSMGVKSVNEIDEYIISFYGKYKDVRPYVSWNLGMGYMTNDTEFVASTVNTWGEYDTYAFFANLEAGYNFGDTVCTVIEPYVGIEVTRLFSEGFDERGTGARHFDRMTWDIVEIPIGLRMAQDLFYENHIFTPSVDVAYARNIGDTSATTTSSFVGNRMSPWKVSSSSDKRDTLRGNINLKINSGDLPFALNIGYSIDYRSDYYNQQFYGTMRWDF
jgi:hypothetical protein